MGKKVERVAGDGLGQRAEVGASVVLPSDHKRGMKKLDFG